MRKLGIIFAVLLCGLLVSLGVAFWPAIQGQLVTKAVDRKQEAADYKKAEELLSQSKPEESLAIIKVYRPEIENFTESGNRWGDLLIRVSETTGDRPQLVALYEHSPKAFDTHEKAVLLVGDTYLIAGKVKEYQALRDSWKGRETMPERWYVMDADKLLVQGKKKEAIDFLKGKQFSGKEDTGRLIRLALLTVVEQPKAGWDYLTEAYNKDPMNPDIRSYRAKLLEAIGKNSLALSEYMAALSIDPKNQYLRDQLADFYIRHKQYVRGLQVLSEGLTGNSVDYIWLKTLFWSKVAFPVKFDWKTAAVPKGKLQPLVDYLLTLKPGQFWDEASFDKISDSSQYLKTQQATFWLRLLATLKAGHEKEALDLLQYNPFSSVSWDPQLEKLLKMILVYRKSGNLNINTLSHDLVTTAKASQQENATQKDAPAFFAQIEELAKNSKPEQPAELPPEIKKLLLSKDAFSATFLAAGWLEAGLQLQATRVIPDGFPDWVAYAYTQALRLNRGNMEALEFATLQKQTPTLQLLIGELLVASGSHDSGMEQLKKLYKEQNDIGYRAAWLLSLLYIEKGEFKNAKETVEAQPKLAQDILGKETLARIAMLEGNSQLADQLYTEIEPKSSEAKSYLARKAFAEKNWKRAKELTQQLLIEFPNNPLLVENMKKILEEEKQPTTTK